jgi:hypothetical protein
MQRYDLSLLMIAVASLSFILFLTYYPINVLAGTSSTTTKNETNKFVRHWGSEGNSNGQFQSP